jgi:AraC-like DNA-binding protein
LAEWIDSLSSALGAEDRTALADLGAPVAESEEDGSESSAEAVGRSGLAPWQVRRVTMHIESQIDTVIRIGDLARICRLSTSHFIRSFRISYGDSPHRHIMRRRTERAQGLMLTTAAPLGQIAQECGLADQSHLTRLFHRFVGESPGTWRRARSTRDAAPLP